MFKRFAAFLITITFAALAFIPGCKKEPQKIKVAYIEATADLPFFVALEKGYFKEQGLEVEAIASGNSSEALNALLAGKVDIIAPISFSALLAAEIQDPGELKLFLTGGETEDIVGSYLLVKKDSPISSIEDLRDKKIGTYSGATQLLYLKLFLKKVGLDPDKDVTIVQVGPNLQSQALEAGQFDALFTVEPFATIAIQQGVAEVLVENPRVKYIVNPFLSGSAATTSSFVDENPKALKKFSKAMDKAIDFIRTNEAEARSIISKYTPLDSTLAGVTGLLKWYKVGETTDADMQAIQKIADLLHEEGILSDRVVVADMFVEERYLK